MTNLFALIIVVSFQGKGPERLATPEPGKSAAQSQTSQRIGDVTVSIVYAARTPIRVRKAGGEMATTDEEHLSILVQIFNESKTKKLTYAGWQPASLFADHLARLTDDHGNRYARITLPIGDRFYVQKRTPDSIYPSKGLVDELIFEAPTDAATRMTLSLPGKTLGLDEGFTMTFDPKKVKVGSKAKPLDATYFLVEKDKDDAEKIAWEAALERDRKMRETEEAQRKAEADARMARKNAPLKVDGIELVGFVGKGPGAKAFVRILPSKKTMIVKKGQELSGWIVAEIDQDAEKIVVTDPKGKRQTLTRDEVKSP